MKVKCAYCKKVFEILAGAYNRAKRNGHKVYCSKEHSGLGRRSGKTTKQKKAHKSAYDRKRRIVLANEIKTQKADYFKKDYAANPGKYKKQRKKRQAAHNEYCRQPKYKAYKKKYDRRYRANKFYEPMAEAFLVLLDLERQIDNRVATKQNNVINKSQKRKRSCHKQTPKNSLSSLLHP